MKKFYTEKGLDFKLCYKHAIYIYYLKKNMPELMRAH